MENFEIIKFANDAVEMDVSVSPTKETVWLSINDMCTLFGRDKSVISRHIKNILKEECLDLKQVVAKNATTGSDGKTYDVTYYNLDVIISVGYRVKSNNGIIFRRWANQVLKDYLIKGYSISKARTLVTDENYVNLIKDVNNLKKDVSDIKEIVAKKFSKEFLLFEGEVFNAYIFLNNLFKSARESIFIIDGYLDDSIFQYLVGISRNTKVTFACAKPERLSKYELGLFEKQNDSIKIIETKSFHDRFICIDDVVYHLGTSFNSFANKTTTIIKMESVTMDDLLKAIK